MTEPTHYDCTLTAREVPYRVQQIRQLTRGLQSRRHERGEIRLRFDPALAPAVRAFVRDEARCCSFYDFAVTQDDEAVELTVRAPAGAEPLLAHLSDAFAPDPHHTGSAPHRHAR